MKYWLVMPAAGVGRRFGAATPKQYAMLAGRTVIEWALAPFLEDARCAGSVVAVTAEDSFWPAIGARLPQVTAAAGGRERSQSVRNGLAALAGRAAESDWVLVHDAARPCLPREDLQRLLAQLGTHPVGGLLALPAADTLKRSGHGADVAETVDRALLWRAQTPQMFRYAALCAALDAAERSGRVPTDEAQAMEWSGMRPQLVPGSASNIKITGPADLALAGSVRGVRDAGAREYGAMRIGSGIDVHAFGPGDAVMLGGVRVPHDRGVVAHSDGDVLLHALCDALLGAAGLGDIGQHFKDSDPRWRGADSRHFVREVMAMLRERGLAVGNADLTLLAEKPRLGPHRDAIRTVIAELLGVDAQRVNLKATTTERLGFLGRGEGLAAEAVVLLVPAAAA